MRSQLKAPLGESFYSIKLHGYSTTKHCLCKCNQALRSQFFDDKVTLLHNVTMVQDANSVDHILSVCALTILQRVKVVVHALLGEELLVVADLLDFAFAHDDDFVSVLDS